MELIFIVAAFVAGVVFATPIKNAWNTVVDKFKS